MTRQTFRLHIFRSHFFRLNNERAFLARCPMTHFALTAVFLLMALLLLMIPGAVLADDVPKLRVAAFFKDKVVIYIDGKRRTLKKGQPSPEGVTLLWSSSNQAEVKVGDQVISLGFGMVGSGQFKQPKKIRAEIPRGTDGMYKTVGTINGQTVNFMVDTGASIVAMSMVMANYLGLDYQSGQKRKVNTASGVEVAYFITLDEVQVGDIKMRQVEGAVIPNKDGRVSDPVLLGMSFLSRVNMKDNGVLLQLEKKF